MRPIACAISLLLAPIAIVSCGSKEETTKEVSTTTHAEIADGVAAAMSEMMNEMAKIKDVASAEAFAAKVPEIKTKLKGYLESAQDLATPTAEQKAAFEAKMNAAQEQAGPGMMSMMMGMSQNPDADAIGKILEDVMDDAEMEKVMEKLEGIYGTDEAEAAPAGE